MLSQVESNANRHKLVSALFALVLCVVTIQHAECIPLSIDFIIDDSDAEYVGNWSYSKTTPGYYETGYRYRWTGSGNNIATWNLIVPQKGLWEVYTRWTSGNEKNRATDAPYTINYDNGSTNLIVNQNLDGGRWVSLGKYTFDMGIYNVSLSDNADGVVIADAIMLVQREIIIEDEADTDTWIFNIFQEGNWEVYTRWTTENNDNKTSNPSFIVNHADDYTIVHVNEQTESEAWISLGNYPFTVKEASVILSDDADGIIKADSVKLVQRDIIVDDGEAVIVGNWGSNATQLGYYGEGYRYMWNGSGNFTVTWNIDIPEPSLWKVYTRWTKMITKLYENKATDAPYTINHDNGSTTIRVNQTENGGHWYSLGTYNFSEGKTSIILSNDANNVAIADAIKLVQQKPQKYPLNDVALLYNFSEKLLDNNLQLGVQLDWNDWKKIINNQNYQDYVTAFNCKLYRIFVFRQDGIGEEGVNNTGPIIEWNSIYHNGTFDWTEMDQLIEKIHELGGEPMLCLMYPYRNSSIHHKPTNMTTDEFTGLPDPDDWAEYCRVWVHKYGDKVRFWEVMNEPDLYWGLDIEESGKVENLTNIYLAAYHAMKNESSSILISHSEVQDYDIFQNYTNDGIPFDYLNFHYYGTGGDTSYRVNSKDVFTNADTGYSVELKNNLLSLDYIRSLSNVTEIIQICGETNFNSAWKNGSDFRNQKMDGAVFDALQIVNAMKVGSDYRIHFHLSSKPEYDESNNFSNWNLGFGMINQENALPYYPWYVYKMIGGNLEVGDPIYTVESNNSYVNSISWRHNDDLNALLIHSDTVNREIEISGLYGEFNFTKIDETFEYWRAQEQDGIINLSEENLILEGYSVVLLQSENYFSKLELNSEYGTVTGAGNYSYNTKVNFSVTPNIVPGKTGVRYVFLNWTSNSPSGYNGPENPTSIIMYNNITETANWKTQYFFTLETGLGGTVSQSSDYS